MALAVMLGACGGSSEGGSAAVVDAVVDGDTIVLQSGEHVRLVQIDAPEAGDGECYGAEATRLLEQLLPTQTEVELEADPALDDIDRFGRPLRYVHVEGLNVNLELVRLGAATVWFFNGDRGRYSDELLAVGEEARQGLQGLWGACPETPFEPFAPATTGQS